MEFESIKTNHLTSIQQLAAGIAKANDLQGMLDCIVDHIYSQLKSFDCALFLYESSHQDLICYSYRKQGVSEKESFKLKPVKLGAGIIGHTAQTQRTMKVDDTEQSNIFVQDLQNNYSELCVPILLADELIGVIDLEHPDKSFFSEEDAQYVETIAAMVSYLIKQHKTEEKLHLTIEKLKFDEKKLRDKEVFYRNLMEQASDSIFIHDQSGRFLDVNQQAVLSLGYSREELLQMRVKDIDIESGQGINSGTEFYRRLRPGEPVVVECKHQRKDGSVFPVEVKVGLLTDDNIIAVARDVSKRQQVLNELDTSKRFMQDIINTSPDVIYVFDFEKDLIIDGADRFASYLGYEDDRFESWSSVIKLAHPDDIESLKERGAKVLNSSSDEVIKSEARFKNAKGEWVWLKNHCKVVKRTEQGTPLIEVGTVSDISHRKAIEKELINKEEYYRALVENAFDGIVLYDEKGRVQFLSNSVEKLLGYKSEDVKHKTGIDFIFPSDVELVRKAWHWVIAHPNQIYRIPDYRLVKKDGDVIWVENTLINLLDDPVVNGIISNFRDIGHKKSAEQSIYKISNYDSLTELPNRNFLRQQIERQIKKSKNGPASISLVYFDIVQLNSINNAMGHWVGDQVLHYVARIIRENLDEFDLIARSGNDEFAVVLTEQNPFEISQLVERILDSFDNIIRIGDLDLKVSLRAGIARYPEDADNAEDLLSRAEVAVGRVKNLSTQYTFFQPQDSESIRYRINLERELVQAIDDEALELFYQPKVCLRTGVIESVEALLRWNHPQNGYISPQTIVNIAEANSLIYKLTSWVVENAVKQIKDWAEKGLNTRIAVNLSARDIQREGFEADIRSSLEKYQVDSTLLDIEITESAAMANMEHSVQTLRQLSDLGIGISLDDFGTGYSSISYLASLPVDLVKIDQTFIQGLKQASEQAVKDNQLVIKNIIRLAESFKLVSLVEGIETIEQCRLLQKYNCDLGQGYLFSKPKSAKDIEPLLRKGYIDMDIFKIAKPSVND
ncbi:diguanylate cyclase [Kangiella profundi]|uniref:Diguanylate cyclase n=1 Tax=Kangiella profundi TaxID=1561924 RepID=A0A2K9AHP6_9GAMM|nr:EAL domain-containing protein [Kangiella profundi]AUD78474.1 diguanylate cyclase [Kangiella profundi]GGF08221.1 hypothetical protein GCM10011356_22160 [Kangiella profundi]